MLNLRYIITFLGIYTTIGVFFSIVSFCNLYSMNQDDDGLLPDECLKKFSTSDPDNMSQPGFEQSLDLSLINQDSNKTFFDRFTTINKKDPLSEKRMKIFEDYDSLKNLMPEIGYNILRMAFAYRNILKYAQENISSLPEDQKIDLYLFVLLLHYQLFPDPSKSLISLFNTDIDTKKSRSILLSILNVNSKTNFEENIKNFLQEIDSINGNSTTYITYYLSSLAHEMFSLASLDLARTTLDYISGKIEAIHHKIEALYYSVTVYLIVDKIYITPMENIPEYEQIKEIIKSQNVSLYDYVKGLSNLFTKDLYKVVSVLKTKDLIGFLKLSIKFPTLFDNPMYPYTHFTASEKELNSWILFTLATDEFIKYSQSHLKPLEDVAGLEIEIDGIYDYFSRRQKLDFLRFIAEYCEIEGDINKDRFIVSDEYISLITTVTYWISTRSSKYQFGTRIPTKDIVNIVNLITQKFIKLNDINKFFFIWFMVYMNNVYEDKIGSQATYLNKVVSMYTASHLIKNVPKISVDILEYLLEIMIPDIFTKSFVNLYNNELLSKNYILSGDILYYLLINQKFSPYLENLNFNLSYSTVNLKEILKKVYSYPLGVKTVRKLLGILGRKITSTRSLYTVLEAIEGSFCGKEISYFLDTLDVDNFIKRNPKINKNVEKYFFSINDSISFRVQKITDSGRVKINQLIYYYLLQKESPSVDEINFLIRHSNLPNSNPNKVKEIIFSSAESDFIQIILTNTPFYNENKKEVIDHILTMDSNLLKDLDQNSLIEFLKILISYQAQSTDMILDLKKFINKLLYLRNDVLETLKTECTKFSISYSDIKKYLITNAFMQKEIRHPRDKNKKEQLIKKEKEGTLRATDVEDLISDLTQSDDSSTVYEFLDLFSKLIDQEQEKKLSGNYIRNGKKESKELQKSLNLILNMFQNISFEDKTLTKQIMFSNINENVLRYLISNINNYNNFKTLIYSIICYQIDNNIIILSKSNWLVDIVKELTTSRQIGFVNSFNLVTKILNRNDIDNHIVSTLTPILVSLLKSDTKSNKNSTNEFKVFNSENIIKILIPIISKHQELVSDVIEVLKDRLSLTHSLSGVDRINLEILQINQEIIHAIDSLTLHKRIIALSILPSNLLLVIKNAPSSKYNFYTKDTLERADESFPKFIYELSQSTLSAIEKTLDLRDTINKNLLEILNTRENFASEEAMNLREQTSIYKVLLDKILSGYIPLDLSAKKYIGLGYDVFCLENGLSHYIEVKSKMSLFSKEYPPVITPNEIRFALSVHNSDENTKYSLYIVPLNNQERKYYGDIIDADIDWNKLQFISDHLNVFISRGINGNVLLEEFVKNLKRDQSNN